MMSASLRPINLLLLVGALAATGLAWTKPICEWNEYYDENMNDCGPCREICDHMAATGTEEQCKTECREYLMSRKCTYLEFYDHGTESCEPCSDICNHREIQGTQKDCSDKCVYYLRSLNCTKIEEYFNETLKKCASCAVLCDGIGVSRDPCHQKCHAFVEKKMLVDHKNDPLKSHDDGTTRNPPPESLHPGVITTIAVAALVVALGLGTLIVYVRRRTAKGSYARGNDSDDAEADEGVDVMRSVRPRNGRIFMGTVDETRPAGVVQGQVVMAETSLSKTSIQETPDSQTAADVIGGVLAHVLAASGVSLESDPLLRASVDSLTVSLNSGSVEDVWRVAEVLALGEGSQEQYAIPECDPLAPSSAGFAQTRRDPPCSVEECGV